MLNYNPHDRHNIKLHLQITLLQPMSHISESVGNQTNLRTMKVTDLEGNPSEVFTLSGNSLRNRILRRCGIDSFLDQIGVQVSPTMHHALFCGGAIDGGTGNDLDLDKKIRQLLPCLSVLGTAKPKGLWGKLDLGIRTVTCLGCGTTHDRDENAAKNIDKVGIGNCHDSKRTRRDNKTASVASLSDALRITVASAR